MKAYGGAQSTDPHILNYGTKWRWVVNITPRPIYPQYPLNTRMGGRHGRSTHSWKRKSLTPTGFERRTVQPVAYSLHHKVHTRTGHAEPYGEYSYTSTPSLTSALDVGGWSTPRPGCFTPGKEPLYRRLGGPQGRSGQSRPILNF
jgi:hypothetical protein